MCVCVGRWEGETLNSGKSNALYLSARKSVCGRCGDDDDDVVEGGNVVVGSVFVFLCFDEN